MFFIIGVKFTLIKKIGENQNFMQNIIFQFLFFC